MLTGLRVYRSFLNASSFQTKVTLSISGMFTFSRAFPMDWNLYRCTRKGRSFRHEGATLVAASFQG